jgi:hypothetical protein
MDLLNQVPRPAERPRSPRKEPDLRRQVAVSLRPRTGRGRRWTGLLLGAGPFLIVLGTLVQTLAAAPLETARPDLPETEPFARLDSLQAAYDSLHARFFTCGNPDARKQCVEKMDGVIHEIKTVRQAWQAMRGPDVGRSYVVWDSIWADPYPAIEESLRIPAERLRQCKIHHAAESQDDGYHVKATVLNCEGTWVTITSVRALVGLFAASDTAYIHVTEAPEIIASDPEGRPWITCIYEETGFRREFYVILEQTDTGFRIVSKGFSYGED